MDSSSKRLFNRQLTVHQILGGGTGMSIVGFFIHDLKKGNVVSGLVFLSLRGLLGLLLLTLVISWGVEISATVLEILEKKLAVLWWCGVTVADVMLWRRKNVTVGVLLVTLAAWVVFERSGYTLLSLVANVLLLLIVILFLWAKAAAILNRPPPPLPKLQLSEELVNEVATFVRLHVNKLLLISHDIALGKNPKLFLKVAAYLLLIAVVGGWTDFLTLGYTSLVIVFTVPALYEKYEDHIDKYVMQLCMELQRLHMKLDAELFGKIRKWILEKRKLN